MKNILKNIIDEVRQLDKALEEIYCFYNDPKYKEVNWGIDDKKDVCNTNITQTCKHRQPCGLCEIKKELCKLI